MEINMEAFPRTKIRARAQGGGRGACLAIAWVQFPVSQNKPTVMHTVLVNGHELSELTEELALEVGCCRNPCLPFQIPAHVSRNVLRGPLLAEVALVPLTLRQGGKITKQGWKTSWPGEKRESQAFPKEVKPFPTENKVLFVSWCKSAPSGKKLKASNVKLIHGRLNREPSWLLQFPQLVSVACWACPMWWWCLHLLLHVLSLGSLTWGGTLLCLELKTEIPADCFSGPFSVNFCWMF